MPDTTVTITLEEYKKLLDLQIRAVYEERIKELQQKLKEQEEETMHWWRELRKAEEELRAYKEAHPEKGGDTDGILRESE